MDWDDATKALINDVAEEAASKTVSRTMTSLGVDISNPIEVQADFRFIRSLRENWAATKSRSWFVAIGLTVTGGLSFFWTAIKAAMHGGPPAN